MDDVASATTQQRDFLFRKADKLIEELENRHPPSVVIPQCLRQKLKASPVQPQTKQGEGAATADGGTRAERKRVRNAGGGTPEKDAPTPVINPERQQEWEIPAGKLYTDFFPKGAPSQTGWPKQIDPRYDTPRGMCLRFQVKGKCTAKCSMAHVVRSAMTAKDETEVAARIKRILGK
jgi:hypothetical protein